MTKKGLIKEVLSYVDGQSKTADASRLKSNISILEGHLFNAYQKQNDLNRELTRLAQDAKMLKSARDKMKEDVQEIERVERKINSQEEINQALNQEYQKLEEKNKTTHVILRHLESLHLQKHEEIDALDKRIDYNRRFFAKVFEGIDFWNERTSLEDNLSSLKHKLGTLRAKVAGELKLIKDLQLEDVELEAKKNDVQTLRDQIQNKAEELNNIRIANMKVRDDLQGLKERNDRANRKLIYLSERTSVIDISLENKDSQEVNLPRHINPENPHHQELLTTFKGLMSDKPAVPEKEKLQKEVEDLEFYYANAVKARRIISDHFKLA